MWEGDKKASTEVREMENADYMATHKDYSESVDALERAVAVLKKQAYDRTQAELMQVNSLKLVPEHAKKVISAFLSQGDELGADPMSVSAPQANAYEFQSQVRCGWSSVLSGLTCGSFARLSMPLMVFGAIAEYPYL